MRAAATFYEMLLGAVLLLAPWTRLWEENWFLWNAGALGPLLGGRPLRGAVSGFGAALLLVALGRILGVSVVAEDPDA